MTEKFVTLPREVLEQALNALEAGVKISPNSVLHDRLRAALEQPQGDQEPVAWCVMNGVSRYQLLKTKVVADALAAEMQKRHDLSGSIAAFHVKPAYTHPQDLRCKSNQARLATLWGYVKADQPQAEQEPVAWRLFDDDPIPGTKPKWVYYDKDDFVNDVDPTEHFQLECLYTHPQPKRDPLPDHYINDMFSAASIAEGDMFRRFARAIEAAHNIK